ncbi:hypothetical protein [Providencia rustigianii]|nr:hypothetical protein [Providencia rustigianii]SUC29012.1 Uncharacterised protein [Providencia rustigianii]
MRRYIPLLPVFIFIVFSSMAFLDENATLNVGRDVVNFLTTVYAIRVFFLFGEKRSDKDTIHELKGITNSFIPLDLIMYRLVIVLSIIAVFLLMATNQWSSIPLLMLWFIWQHLNRKLISAVKTQG